MIKAYKWQSLAFSQELRTLLNHHGGDSINYLEFRILRDQARLIFLNSKEEARCIALFERSGFVSKKELLTCLCLVTVIVKHCKKN
jgi:hypothetical protein